MNTEIDPDDIISDDIDIDTQNPDPDYTDRELQPSQKENIIGELEPRPIYVAGEPEEDDDGSIALQLGDIIEIYAPSNPDIHEVTAIITYIDETKIKLINVATMKFYQLNITEDGRFTDETITRIALLDRNDEKGYARQNNLSVKTWVDIHFGGEIPAIITGEITNLEEDMIEITTFPDLRTIYIDFAYKGIPENLPIENIVLREKPASVTTSLSALKGQQEEDQPDFSSEDQASIEYTDVGESIIRIPEQAVPDENIRNTLQELYLDANSIVFGERLAEVTQLVEVPEEEKRYSVETQTTDFMEELLSTIPNSQRTKRVMDNIHVLIHRFKELRKLFSKFDSNENIYDVKTVGPFHKPLVDFLQNFNKKLLWIVPVVSNRKKINFDSGNISHIPENTPEDILVEKYVEVLKELERADHTSTRRVGEWLKPFETQSLQSNNSSCLTNLEVGDNIDTIVDNLETLSSTVYTAAGVSVRQYVIQRYNLASTHTVKQVLKTQKILYNVEKDGPNDQMCVKSILMLPEPVVRFSAIDLPSTNVLDRSNLHHNYFMLSRLFRKNTDITHEVIDDLTRDDGNTETADFLRGIKDFSINPENMDVIQYEKFLNTIVPNTRNIIRAFRKHLKYKMSFFDVVQRLEPFMIYSDSVTYKQYTEIRYIVKEYIKELKKNYSEKMADFYLLKHAKYNVTGQKQNPVLRVLSENKEFIEHFFQSYALGTGNKNMNTSSGEETIMKVLEYDNGVLYMNMITSLLISLMTPNHFMDVLHAKPNITDMTDLERIKAVDCSQRFLTKKYTSIGELQKDNNTDEVYYDEEFDDTPYSIIKKYEKEQKNLSPEIFVEFLTENLIHKHECPRELAPQLASTIIAKKKRVSEGEYAVVEIRPTLAKGVGADETMLSDQEKAQIEIEADVRKKILYYRRIRDNWVIDPTIQEEAFIDNNTLFCNIGKSCYKNAKNSVCETDDDAASRMRDIYNRKMMDEFDKRYEINVEELEKKLEKNMEYRLRMLSKLQVLREIQLYKANNLAYEIGGYAKNTDDLILSPYLHLRDLILGQDDFSKKQGDISRFVEGFCREPMVAEMNESPNWLYCKESNTKLFPFSLYELADVFVGGGDYSRKLDEVCNSVGVISDDGDAIVDKHSGYILRKLEFDTEEGFDESGFRITTHDIIEQDLGTVIMEAIGKKEQPVFENETNQMIYNVFSKICEHIDIPIEGIYDFVMRVSGELINKNIIKKEVYEKRAAKTEKEKGVQMKPYATYKNETVIYIIGVVVLVSIQTAIPSFRTKKTFPGCVRSFSGYPFDGGVEDMTGLKYIACVLSKTADKSVETWEAIKSVKVETLVSRLKKIIEEYIMKRSDITELYTKKQEYVLLNPENISVEEHSIEKWLRFMPPIVSFEVSKSLTNISSDFQSDLIDVMRKGHKDQFSSIEVLKSKLIKYSYGIIEVVNKIVKTKNLVLKTMTNIPFLENACCNETNLTNPYRYFDENSEGQIQQYTFIAKKIAVLLNDVKTISTASLLYDPTFTGIIYPATPSGQLEENIYEMVIRYCNLDNEKPIPLDFQGILTEKLPNYKKDMSIQEKIELFKRNGKQFGVETLHQILRIVYGKNIVHVENREAFSEIEGFKEILDYLDNCNSIVFEDPLRRKLHAVIDDYREKTMMMKESDNLLKLKSYLTKTNKKMYDVIIDFLEQHAALSDRQMNKIEDFLWNLTEWKIGRNRELSYDEEMYAVAKFVENAIYSMTKVYPTFLLSEDKYYDNVPKHWKISNQHAGDIEAFIEKYYSRIEPFQNDDTLVQLFQHVNVCLLDIHVFVKSIPIYTEIIKPVGAGADEMATFYSMFDKDTVYLLHKYCFLSCLYEYVVSSDDSELLRTNIQQVRKINRDTISERKNASNEVTSVLVADDDTADLDESFQEVQINIGNKQELKEKVASLLIAFLETEIDNKNTVNMSYKDIKEKVTRSKNREKQGIITRFKNMENEERAVENMLKNYRIGRWNVGQQKGLIQYDKDTYDRERLEMLADPGIYDDEVSASINEIHDFDYLDKTNEQNAAEEESRAIYGLEDLGNGDGFTDGVFYEEDRDEEDFYE